MNSHEPLALVGFFCFVSPLLFSCLVRDNDGLFPTQQLIHLSAPGFSVGAIVQTLFPSSGSCLLPPYLWQLEVLLLHLLYSSFSVVCGIPYPAKIGLSDLIKNKNHTTGGKYISYRSNWNLEIRSSVL